MGDLSFHTQHKNGAYTDHEGTRMDAADTHSEVTVHHATGSFASGDFAENATSQHGMDAIIYKVSKEGVPQMVFAADSLPADADTNPYAFHALNSDELGPDGINNGSVNGRTGSMVEIFEIDSFADENDMVVVGGTFRGKLTFPGVSGDIVLVNTKNSDRNGPYTAPHFNWDNQDAFVAKVNMTTGKALWATVDGLTVPETSDRASSYDIATTKAGHVIYSFDERHPGRKYTSQLTKFDGTDGTKLWEVEFTSVRSGVQPIRSLDGDSTDEVVYITGTLKGTDVDPFGTGTNRTSNKQGDAFVAALDVSGTSGPAANWIFQVGQGAGYTVQEQGEHLIVAGSLSGKVEADTTIGTCSLTGDLGGFIMKLTKADGACVWAKDTPAYHSAVSDGASVWTFGSGNGKVTFGADYDLWATNEKSAVHCDGRCYDIVMGKYDASNGNGLWASVIGGTGADSFGGAVMTPDGPVLVAESTSETIQFGGLTLNHLQHASPLIDNAIWGPNRRGPKAMFSMLIDTDDVLPSCIAECPSNPGEVSAANTIIKPGQCYAYNECLATGDASKFFPCFKCDAAGDQKALSGQAANDPIDGFCYFDEKCIPTGGMRDEYVSGNEPSVCEWCGPAVDKHGWSLRSGFVHDRTFAQGEDPPSSSWGRRLQAGEAGQANDFGMLFEKESNGCQILPAMTMPVSPSADLTAALVALTSSAIADVATRASNAIAAVRSATSTNQHAEIAWAHYIGDCAGDADACPNTPAALADAMGQEFDTHLHYGDSVARVKVQQGLSMLIDALADPASEDAHIADLKKDIVAHMLIPYYQAAIKSAHRMDVAGADNDAQAPPKAEGKVYWSVINDAVGGDGGDFIPAADRNYITSVFSSATAGDSFNYCAVWDRLHEKYLPPASNLQYVNYVRQGTMATIAGDSVVHMTDKDVGTLSGPRVPTECKMPPPPPSPPPPPPPPPPAPPSAPPVSSTSNSLSDGEIAGVAVGAGLGAILLLLFIGLVLRAFLFKEAKPIFTCLEAKETTKTPAASVDPSKV